MSKISDKLPSIPMYYKQYVDPKVNLDETPSQPCPFHNEVSGKSFSYSRDLGIWRCFGACHCGGDVIDLHKINYRYKSRKEAETALYKLYGISLQEEISFEKEEVEVNEADVHRRRVYGTALRLATTPDDWEELDYVVSKVPYDVKELETFCATRGVLFNHEQV